MIDSFWYVACRSKELSKRPISRTIFKTPVVLFRDIHGIPCALEDRCAHRNYPLSEGRVVNGTIQCGYHGWCYNSLGHVCTIPSLPDTELHDNISVPQYPCVEKDGYIWIVPSSKPVLDAPPDLPFIRDTGFYTFYMKTHFDSDVETCLENFLDCPHAAFVHSGLFRSHNPRPLEAEVRSLSDGAEVEYFSESRKGGLVWKLLSREKAQLKHIDRFIRPATSRVDYIFSDKRQYVITSHCTPVTENETVVYTSISFRFGLLGFLIKPIFHLLSRRIIKQDVCTVRKQRLNLYRFGERPKYRVIKTDFLLPYIRQWRNALEQNKDINTLNSYKVLKRVSLCI